MENMRSIESEVGGRSVGYENGFGWEQRDDEMVNGGRSGAAVVEVGKGMGNVKRESRKRFGVSDVSVLG
ncbi:hypothetical protein V6N13_072674 [Hibiscus sabdariffa]|uniref:Uncharacterized protein n=1 Tax=Hibiscus sabdariffa TaxID=183260 RepID=A0ABR2E6S0_9ROSI